MFSAVVLLYFLSIWCHLADISSLTACELFYNVTLKFLLLFYLDNELTVGKVYAALMIFDYYKQNRAKRLQEQQPASGTQVDFYLNLHITWKTTMLRL